MRHDERYTENELPTPFGPRTPETPHPDEGLRVLERELDHGEGLLPDRP